MPPLTLSDIQSEALAAGFALAGVRRPSRPVHFEAYDSWLAGGLQASMDWIARPYARRLRADPGQLLPGCRSILSLGALYPPSTTEVPIPGFGRVASYAWVKDYHSVLTQRLKDLARRILATAGQSGHFKVFVDSSPLLERDLAAMSGLGWSGKNTCLISPSLGSFLFLSEILFDIDLPESQPFEADRCGTCRRCIEACPTRCIREDRLIDSGRCISYLTIEHKGLIDPGLRGLMGAWVFGCDVCQIVCPWNCKAALHPTAPFFERWLDPGRVDLAAEILLTQDQFDTKYAGTPLQRAGWENHLRNCLIAAGNSDQEAFVSASAHILSAYPSPLLRGAAAWVLGRFPSPLSRQSLASALPSEPDPLVRTEILTALESFSG